MPSLHSTQTSINMARKDVPFSAIFLHSRSGNKYINIGVAQGAGRCFSLNLSGGLSSAPHDSTTNVSVVGKAYFKTANVFAPDDVKTIKVEELRSGMLIAQDGKADTHGKPKLFGVVGVLDNGRVLTIDISGDELIFVSGGLQTIYHVGDFSLGADTIG